MDKPPKIGDLDTLRAAADARRRIPDGVSLTDLAAVVGVSAQSVLRWERGEPVPAAHAAAYADALEAITAPPPTELTAQDRAEIREKFRKGEGCAHCGGYHVHACPRVKRFAFHTNEVISEIEFWPQGEWPTDNVIFPEQVVDPDEEEA